MRVIKGQLGYNKVGAQFTLTQVSRLVWYSSGSWSSLGLLFASLV